MAADNDDWVGNDLGEVRACDCGGVNLVLGPMTLHLTSDEVTELHELTGAAVALVQQGGRWEAAPAEDIPSKDERSVH